MLKDKNDYKEIFETFISGLASVQDSEIDQMQNQISLLFNAKVRRGLERFKEGGNFLEALESIIGNEEEEDVKEISPESQRIRDELEIGDDKKIYSKNIYVEYLLHETLGEKVGSEIGKIKDRKLDMAVLSVCSMFEILISQLMTIELGTIRKDTSCIDEKQLTFSKIKQFQSIEEIRDNLIESHIMGLMYGNPSSWIKSFYKQCCKGGVDKLQNKYSHFEKEVLELFNRRNLIIHNNGVVNSKDTYIDDKQYKIGERITTDINYINSKIKIIGEFGISLILEVIKKNRLLNDAQLHSEINNLFLDYIKYFPLSIRGIYISLYKNDINSKDDYRTLHLLIDQFNIWLTYFYENDEQNFEVMDQLEWEFIKNEQKENSIGKYAIAVIDGLSDSEIISFACEYLSECFKNLSSVSISNRNRSMVEYLSLPMFDVIRNKQEFIDYISDLS